MPRSTYRQVDGQQVRRDLGSDQLSAQQHAQDDGSDGQALDPAIGLDQLGGRQQLGEDAVLGRRVGGGAQADDRVREQRVRAEQHQQAADDLDAVRIEHHLRPPGPGVRERSTSGARRRHSEQREHRHLQGRALPFRRAGAPHQLDGRDEQGVVGQRGVKNCADMIGVEASFSFVRHRRQRGLHPTGPRREKSSPQCERLYSMRDSCQAPVTARSMAG